MCEVFDFTFSSKCASTVFGFVKSSPLILYMKGYKIEYDVKLLTMYVLKQYYFYYEDLS